MAYAAMAEEDFEEIPVTEEMVPVPKIPWARMASGRVRKADHVETRKEQSAVFQCQVSLVHVDM